MKKVVIFLILAAVILSTVASAALTDYSSIGYKELARHPDAHTGDKVSVTGEVNQVIDG